MINVTKTFLPSFESYSQILKTSWEKGWITNNGDLVKELEKQLKEYLGTQQLLFCNNGTIVLQMALKAFNITKEVITTPFSYVATSNAIVWEGCRPVFVDIDPTTFCIDPAKIEAAITPDTEAILATHVYGIPCDVEAIASIAKRHNLRVIYDGAHAFGCRLNGKALLSYGDLTTCSFHATKVFHTVEGGCIITNTDEATHRLLYLYRQFGHEYDNYYSVGVNGKNSEFHAAMGLAVLPHVPDLIDQRKAVFHQYQKELAACNIKMLDPTSFSFEWNYCYFPVLFKDEGQMLKVKTKLDESGINSRRYFYPSLNQLPFLEYQPCPISEEISIRILCLPLYPGLDPADVSRISNIICQLV